MTTKRMLAAFAAASLIALASSASAGDIYVIAHSGTQVTAADVREIYLGEKTFTGAIKLVPVDNAAAQDEFLAKVMKMESGKYTASWTKKTFRDGVSPPPLKGGDAETIQFVKSTAGAVGYVTTSPAGVTVVGKF
jgi:hypothetical protein